MSDATERLPRNVEEEEPLEGQKVVKGPDWLRKLLVGEE